MREKILNVIYYIIIMMVAICIVIDIFVEIGIDVIILLGIISMSVIVVIKGISSKIDSRVYIGIVIAGIAIMIMSGVAYWMMYIVPFFIAHLVVGCMFYDRRSIQMSVMLAGEWSIVYILGSEHILAITISLLWVLLYTSVLIIMKKNNI